MTEQHSPEAWERLQGQLAAMREALEKLSEFPTPEDGMTEREIYQMHEIVSHALSSQSGAAVMEVARAAVALANVEDQLDATDNYPNHPIHEDTLKDSADKLWALRQAITHLPEELRHV